MMAGRLDGRAAIVTGAGRGIGRAIVERLVAEGAQVAALDLDPDEVETLSGVLPIACNVADSASVAKAIAVARDSFGRLDIAVNNAGIGRAAGDGSDEFYGAMAAREAEVAEKGSSKIFVDQLIHMEDDGWAGVMAVNLNGTFYVCREFARQQAKDGRSGAIINVSSTSAQSGEGSAHYVASKAAVISLTRQLARELAPRNIRVNAIAPGPTATPIMEGIPDAWIKSMEQSVPLGRMAAPAEIAAAVAFLASDDASFVNGSVLAVNGASYYF
jgi:NAD(P)-dependent dehydrogenase (short-subunit alcohol dehydrogenase family)